MKSFLLALIIGLAGCASVQNTPAQDRAWAAYNACKAETGSNAVIQQIFPDGRWTVLCSDRCVQMPEFRQCMADKVRRRNKSYFGTTEMLVDGTVTSVTSDPRIMQDAAVIVTFAFGVPRATLT